MVYGEDRNIQQERASLPHEFGNGIAFVEPLGPKTLVVPAILADGDAENFRIEAENVLRMRGLEIACLVEYVIGGKKHLALLEENFSVGDQGGGIRDGLAGVVLRLAYEADDRRKRNGFREPQKLSAIAFDEDRSLDKILRRVSAKTKLGKNGEIRAARLGFAGQFEDAG